MVGIALFAMVHVMDMSRKLVLLRFAWRLKIVYPYPSHGGQAQPSGFNWLQHETYDAVIIYR
jgi:hypothetical protein